MPEEVETEAPSEDSKLTEILAVIERETEYIRTKYGYKDANLSFKHFVIEQICKRLEEDDIKKFVNGDISSDTALDAFSFEETEIGSSRMSSFVCVSVVSPYQFTSLSRYGSANLEPLESSLDTIVSLFKSRKKIVSNMNLKQLVQEFDNYVSGHGYPLKFVFVVGGIVGDYKKEIIQSIENRFKIENITDAVAEVFDLKKIYDSYVMNIEVSEGDIPDVSLRVRDNHYKINSGGRKALVAEVSLSDIYTMYKEYGHLLFIKNLRVPIFESAYNRGIINTLKDKNDRNNFWFYNNGLTTLVEDFSVESTEEDTVYILNARKFQIVNGCQTCSSVFMALSEMIAQGASLDDFNSSSVLVRFIATSAGDANSSFGNRIARFTNSQRPITARDLHATDPEQILARDALRTRWRYFYELKKDQWIRYKERDPAYHDLYDDPGYFSNEKVGQAFVSFWLNNPTFAKNNKSQIFEDETMYERVFGPQVPPEALLLAAQFRHLFNEWRKKKGYKLRSREGVKRKSITRPELVRHGDYYILSIVGRSLRMLLDVELAHDVQVKKLEIYCKNLKGAILNYQITKRDRIGRLIGVINDSFDSALELLYSFSRRAYDVDRDVNARNFLVRSSTWKEFEENKANNISKIAKELHLHLEKHD
ncbi:MAG: AIPR family protein [Thermoplasmatales archaeon]|nr:AIPR family protein [Thermoplasmatales archaeon]